MPKIMQVLFGDATSKVFLLVLNLLLIRFMPVDEYAHFTLIFNAILLGYQLICSAIERLYIADHHEFSKHTFRVLCFLSIFYAIIFSIYLQKKTTFVELIIFISGLWILTIYQFRRIQYQQKQNFWLFSITEIIKNGAWFFIILLLYKYSYEISSVSALLSFLASTILALLVVPRLDKTNKKLNLQKQQKSILKIILHNKHVFFYTILAASFPYLPILMASNDGNETLLATYGAAMRYQGILGMIAYAFNTVFLPKITSFNDLQESINYVVRFYRKLPLIIFGVFFATLVVIILIPFIDGGKYPDLRGIFALLALCSLLSLISIPLISLLLVTADYNKISLAIFTGFLANVFFYIIFSREFRGYEIAISSCVGYGIVNIFLFIFTRTYFFQIKIIKEKLKK